ncbi:MAG TPA: cyanophycinase [Actinomycetota bacterium]|nr:cyanophycinase [Actinomycetota bacterium]
MSINEAARIPTVGPVVSAGPVLLIGGAEDKVRDKVILSRFAEAAGGAEGRVVVISTASALGELATERYRGLFEALGMARVDGLRPVHRADADDPEAARTLTGATGVFLTGGNQLRLSSVVAGTRLADAIHLAHDRGAVVAGTSAGASAMASHMMAFGRAGESPRNRMAQMAAGLGLLTGVVVDQHFSERGRFGRLLSVVALSPSLVGIGLDEDTCAIVHGGRTLEVVGRGAVTIVDGSHVVTDAHQAKGHRPFTVSGAVVHSLPAGTWFDLRGRRLITGEPGEEREASE